MSRFNVRTESGVVNIKLRAPLIKTKLIRPKKGKGSYTRKK